MSVSELISYLFAVALLVIGMVIATANYVNSRTIAQINQIAQSNNLTVQQYMCNSRNQSCDAVSPSGQVWSCTISGCSLKFDPFLP